MAWWSVGLGSLERLRLDRIDDHRVEEHRRIVAQYELPDRLPEGLEDDTLLSLMGRDKKALAGLTFTQDSPANAIFATLPLEAADRIREQVRFYDWDRSRGEVRWMTSWDTTEADVDSFVAIVRTELGRG